MFNLNRGLELWKQKLAGSEDENEKQRIGVEIADYTALIVGLEKKQREIETGEVDIEKEIQKEVDLEAITARIQHFFGCIAEKDYDTAEVIAEMELLKVTDLNLTPMIKLWHGHLAMTQALPSVTTDTMNTT